jgi:hypothetical protein
MTTACLDLAITQRHSTPPRYIHISSFFVMMQSGPRYLSDTGLPGFSTVSRRGHEIRGLLQRVDGLASLR